VNQVVRLDFGLQVGSITEQVSVHAATSLLEHETSSLGQVVLGRAVPAHEAARWKPRDYCRVARETFQLLAPLYRLK
jgi:hypothetical protein